MHLTISNVLCLAISNSYYGNETIWIVTFSDKYPVLNTFNFWLQAVVVKLLPCIALSIMSVILVRTLHLVDIRQSMLLGPGRRHRGHKKQLLLAVVLLFLLSELPHGILNLLSGLLDGFISEVYEPLGDLIDTIALVNNSINFILYCSMSAKFRRHFVQTFLIPIKNKSKKLSRWLESYSLYTYIYESSHDR
jgi:hypothetical protein